MTFLAPSATALWPPRPANVPDAAVVRGSWWARLWRGPRTTRVRQQASRPVLRTQSTTPASGTSVGRNVGDTTFTDFFAQYHAPLIDYLYGMTRNRELATDLAQDTFERAYADAPDLSGIHYPRAWLYTIATRLALNAARHMAHFEWLSLNRQEAGHKAAEEAWATLPLPAFTAQGDDPAATIGERDAVWGVLAELPARWRAVLLLQACAGFEVREIATHLDLSEANVRQILSRAKARFRDRYLQLSEKGAS